MPSRTSSPAKICSLSIHGDTLPSRSAAANFLAKSLSKDEWDINARRGLFLAMSQFPVLRYCPESCRMPHPTFLWLGGTGYFRTFSVPGRSYVRSSSSHTSARTANVWGARQLSRCSLLAGIDHGNLRGQLQIDHQVDTAIDLVAQCSLLRRDDLLKYRNVLHAQCKELLVNSVRSLHVVLRLRIGHGVVVRGILLNHRPPFVIGFDGFLSVLVKNRPELGGLVGG